MKYFKFLIIFLFIQSSYGMSTDAEVARCSIKYPKVFSEMGIIRSKGSNYIGASVTPYIERKN